MMDEIIQGTVEWKQLRLGKVTASRLAAVMSKVKSGESSGVRNYRAQLVCERLTGEAKEGYTNAAMARGTELEPVARECYEFVRSLTVEQVAFVDHPTIAMSGASPDGLVYDPAETSPEGLVEIKCPETAQHIDYLLAQAPPSNYILQMMWQMVCCQRKWCDFISYDPRLPEELQLFIVRVYRDDALIAEMEASVIAFLASVDDTIAKLKALV